MQEIEYADKTEPHFTAVGIAKVSTIGSTLLLNNPKRLYGRHRLDKDDPLFTKPSLVRAAISNNPELEKELSCVEPRRAWPVRSNQPNGSYAGTFRRGFQQSAPLCRELDLRLEHRKNFFKIVGGTWNDVHANQFPDSTRCGGTGVGCGLD